MTPKQEERIRNKIARIRKALAADKKRWGGFHDDSRGLRYVPPEYFVKLRDYRGGLRYLRWFDRTFPDDMGFAVFLFEYTLILFKTGKLKEAEKKSFQTYFVNNYLFNKFLEKPLLPIANQDPSNRQTAEPTVAFVYPRQDPEYADFAAWLENVLAGEKFTRFAREMVEIDRKLATEPAGKTRTKLVKRLFALIGEY